jgi:hypothetical protein
MDYVGAIKSLHWLKVHNAAFTVALQSRINVQRLYSPLIQGVLAQWQEAFCI